MSSPLTSHSRGLQLPGGKPARNPDVTSLLKGVKDKKSRAAVRDAVAAAEVASEWTARTSVLLASEGGGLEAEGMERTYRFKQKDLLEEVGAGAAKSVWQLDLPDHGPYKLAYSRNGRCGHPLVSCLHRICMIHEHAKRAVASLRS